jgi:hypothetical protein
MAFTLSMEAVSYRRNVERELRASNIRSARGLIQ